jgi:hypothetical protein
MATESRTSGDADGGSHTLVVVRMAMQTQRRRFLYEAPTSQVAESGNARREPRRVGEKTWHSAPDCVNGKPSTLAMLG